MESHEIFERYCGIRCSGCGGLKRRHHGFCVPCYRQLPRALKSSLWKHFGAGFEEAYMGSLSWFRTHPFQGEHRAKQGKLFEGET